MILNSKICHITTAHPVLDVRIFHKECKALVDADYDVTLIVQHEKRETIGGVKIIPLPKVKNRFSRMFIITLSAFFLALKQKADVYHFHDPEFLPAVVFLKLFTGKKIIYDVHEDYETKILSKHWIRTCFRKPIAFFISRFEKISSMFFDFVVTADSCIKLKFRNDKTEVFANYPPINLLSHLKRRNGDNIFKVIYVGGISKERGVIEMVEAIKYLKHGDIELQLYGEVEEQELVKYLEPSKKIKYYGRLSWEDIKAKLVNADIGLLLYQPVPSYFNLSGEGILKLYEYMHASIPIVFSGFPRLKRFMNEINCGIAVDPTKPREIAEAIKYLYENTDIRRQMGKNGKNAVLETYNWEKESKKLLKVYEKLLSK